VEEGRSDNLIQVEFRRHDFICFSGSHAERASWALVDVPSALVDEHLQSAILRQAFLLARQVRLDGKQRVISGADVERAWRRWLDEQLICLAASGNLLRHNMLHDWLHWRAMFRQLLILTCLIVRRRSDRLAN